MSTYVVLGHTDMGFNAWASGSTIAEAKERYRERGGELSEEYVLFLEFDADSTFEGIDMMGNLRWRGNPPHVIIDKD